MRIEKNIYLSIVISHLLVTVCFAGTITGAPGVNKQNEAEQGKIVARVNGQPIYKERLAPVVEKDLRKFKKYGAGNENAELMVSLQKKALAKVVDDELVIQASQKIKVSDLDAKVDEKLKKIKRRYKTDEQFEAHLKQQNLTLQQARENLAKQVRVDEYLKENGISDPEIPEKDIKSFYEANPGAYARSETIKVSHILIKVDENAGPKDKKKAREKAEKIRKELLNDKDFAELARQHSECNSASGGGGLGYIEKGYMPEPFDKVAFSLDTNAVSEVVETKFGYHIIKVSEKIPSGIAPYEEVRDFIKKFLQEDASKKKLNAHITALRGKAKIEVLLDEMQ